MFRGDANIDHPTSRFGPIEFLIGEVNNLNSAIIHAIHVPFHPFTLFSHSTLSLHAYECAILDPGNDIGISILSDILAHAGPPSP